MGWIEEHKAVEVEKQRRRLYFADVFSEQLQRWKRINKKTDKDFANAIGVHPNMIPKWKQGKSYPQAAKMDAICKEMGVSESVFNPFTDFDNDYVKNASRKEKSKYLQMYADENGLDEEFFSWLVKQPNFVRDFPFHSIETTKIYQDILPTMPPEEHPEEMQFPLLKFEFEDDFGNRIMMVKEDLDFVLEIQEKQKRYVNLFCLAEKEKVTEQRMAVWLKRELAFYPGINEEEIKREFGKRSFVADEQPVSYVDKLQKIIRRTASEKGIRPRINANEIWPRFNAEETAEFYRRQGFNEEEVARKVKSEKETEENIRERLINKYKRDGFIIEGRD